MSTPQRETAPRSPSTASTTPLPHPISSTRAPRTRDGSERIAWTSAAVYSLGRSAVTAGEGLRTRSIDQRDICNGTKRAGSTAERRFTISYATGSSGYSAAIA